MDGARAILIDRFALDADLVGEVREQMYRAGSMAASVVAGKEQEGAKFKDYFEFSEPFDKLPSHRILALLRGENEGVLSLNLDAGDDIIYEGLIADRFSWTPTLLAGWLRLCAGVGAPNCMCPPDWMCACV